jgi:hypothetical protein
MFLLKFQMRDFLAALGSNTLVEHRPLAIKGTKHGLHLLPTDIHVRWKCCYR